MQRWVPGSSRVVAFLVATVTAVGLALAAAPAAGADDGVRDRADAIMQLTYAEFARQKADEPAPFDWTDDGCSGPALVRPIYRDLFDGPCQQHDFGYRNYGAGGLQLSTTEDTRDWIDGRFLQEMRRLCRTSFDRWYQRANQATCLSQAVEVWGAVRHGGRSAFHH